LPAGQANPSRQASQSPARQNQPRTFDGISLGFSDCKGDDESVLFTVWLPEGSAVEDVMVVRGTLKIIQHAPSQINPNGFTEYRLICEKR
jgi:hypothetical protein